LLVSLFKISKNS